MTAIIGPSYNLNHRKADVQRSINLFPVIPEVGGGKNTSYLDAVPGLVSFSEYVAEDIGFLMTEDDAFLLTQAGGKIILEP